jgi:hypothetical protein
MKITLKLFGGREAEAVLPHPGAAHVVVAGLHCECARDEPLWVAGVRGTARAGEYATTSEAACARCMGRIGHIEVSGGTIFGREEDEQVLHGRYRVY